jgi:hypothetical protein
MVLVFSSLNYSQEQLDFRKTNWGMSKDQVKNSEASGLLQEERNILAYEGNLSSYDCIIGYIFTNNILVRAKYIIMESASNINNYDSDYNTFKAFLTKKYGQPLKDEKTWNNDLYKDNYSNWGHAILFGHVTYYSYWETENSLIVLSFIVQYNDVSIGIEYSSKKHKVLEEDSTLKDF